MDYLLTIVLFILGVCFHVMQKIMILKASFPQLKFGDIWQTFFKQEWDSLVVSGLVLCVAEIALFIAVNNKVTLPNWLDEWGMYLIPLVFDLPSIKPRSMSLFSNACSICSVLPLSSFTSTSLYFL